MALLTENTGALKSFLGGKSKKTLDNVAKPFG